MNGWVVYRTLPSGLSSTNGAPSGSRIRAVGLAGDARSQTKAHVAIVLVALRLPSHPPHGDRQVLTVAAVPETEQLPASPRKPAGLRDQGLQSLCVQEHHRLRGRRRHGHREGVSVRAEPDLRSTPN